MKFLCDRCKTRYAIADERVRGKILKIRCKNCSAVITVREGMDDGGSRPDARTTSAPPTMPPPVAEPPAPAALEEEWYVSKDGNQEGPFTLTEAQAWIAARPVADDLHCWNEGFDDWLPVEKVSHFRGLRGTARPARAATRPGLPSEPEPQPLFAATLAAIEAEAAAAAAAAPPPPAVGGAAAVAQLPPAKVPAPQPWSVPEPVAPTVTPEAAAAPTHDAATSPQVAPRAPTPAVGVPTAPRATPAVGLPALPRTPTPAVGVPAMPKPVAPKPGLPTPFGAPRPAAAEAAPASHAPAAPPAIAAPPPAAPPPIVAPPPIAAPPPVAPPPIAAPPLVAAPPIAAPPPVAPLAAAPRPTRTAARFDTGEADDDPPALQDDDGPGPSATAAHDDDLDIGEVSRVVRLADLMAPPPAAAAPVAPMLAKPRAPTASVAAIGRATGAVPSLGPAAPALPPPVALDGEPLLPPAPAPRRRPVALYLAIGAAAIGGIVATALIVSSGGEDTSGNATTGTGDDYSGIGFRPPDNRGTGASAGTGSGTAAGTGSGRPGPGTGRRPVGSGTGTGAGTAAGTGSGTGSGTATEVPVNPGLRELTPDDVFTMSRRMETGTRRCYERAIKADPFLKVSKIRATITVSATGGVSDVRLSDKADHPLGQCLSAAIKRWPFGPSKAGIVSEFAMVFEQK
jgi:predicted Zn finger-like uncharacterized protein